jgi:GT2 family glycosyltransferase
MNDFESRSEGLVRGGYVVLHYALEDVTAPCIASLRTFAPEAPVLLVDNGSPRPIMTPGVPVLRLDDNLCLAEAMNAGTDELFATTDVDFVVQLNNDVRLSLHTDRDLSWAFRQHARLGVASPVVDKTDVPFMRHPCPYGPGPEAEAYLAATLPARRVEAVAFVDNFALAVRRSTWQAVGGFDTRFSGASWGANYDYCWRARHAGWLVGLVRSAFVHHDHGTTWTRLTRDYEEASSAKMMKETREVWGEMADTVTYREWWHAMRLSPEAGNEPPQ